MIREEADVAILGAGFSGSLLASMLRARGKRVVLIERGAHPRFALGESSTPLANLALEEIARDYGLAWLAPLAEYGSWKRTYPHLVCGLKRGFTYVQHHAGEEFQPRDDHANELLVAASPNDEVGDTHWLRADIDQFLMQKAVEAGAVYLDHTAIARATPGRLWRLAGQRRDEPVNVRARFLVDASGNGGALSRLFGYPPAERMRTDSWAVYSHFEGVARWEDIYRELGGRADDHPYRCDDAALHHVLDDGWMYVLRFDNGVTSAGFLLDGRKRQPDPEKSPEEEWRALLAEHPSIARQFRAATAVRPFERTGRLQRRALSLSGDNWALLAPAAYTLDALFSTGNAHALATVQRLAATLAEGERRRDGMWLDEYASMLEREIDYVDHLVAGCYRAMGDFRLMAAYAMYYFAGAIAAEERRRAGQAKAGEEVLSSAELCDAVSGAHEWVARAAARGGATRAEVEMFERLVAGHIAPFNTVGLMAPAKRNLYPW